MVQFQSDLSKTLSDLSNKAKRAHESINKLKNLHEQININCEQFKSGLNLQIDAIINSIEERRRRLLEFVDIERDTKRRVLKDQITRSSGHLNRTTGLIQFCIEILKETGKNDGIGSLLN